MAVGNDDAICFLPVFYRAFTILDTLYFLLQSGWYKRKEPWRAKYIFPYSNVVTDNNAFTQPLQCETGSRNAL